MVNKLLLAVSLLVSQYVLADVSIEAEYAAIMDDAVQYHAAADEMLILSTECIALFNSQGLSAALSETCTRTAELGSSDLFQPFDRARELLASLSRDDQLALWNTSTVEFKKYVKALSCLLYTSPSPRDGLLSRMPSSA